MVNYKIQNKLEEILDYADYQSNVSKLKITISLEKKFSTALFMNHQSSKET